MQCGGELPTSPPPGSDPKTWIERLYVHEQCGWEPAPGPQTEFIASDAFEVGYGGAAGGGKSESLLMTALKYIHIPEYRGILFRRTIREMRRSLIDRALTGWYNKIAPDGFVGSPSPEWRFPSGAKIEFGNLETEADLANYQSAEYQFIGFDELSHFTEHMYTYMFSRVRSSTGRIPPRIRSGFNPPESLEGAWVVRRFAPWVDRGPDYHGVKKNTGERLYFVNSRQHGEQYVEKGTLDEVGNPAQSRVFIHAKIEHNPYIAKRDPLYKSRLLLLDPVTRARLLDGDFSQVDKPGALWQRDWINKARVASHPELWRIGIGLDPSGSHRKGSDEAGIVVAGLGPCFCKGQREDHVFVFRDESGVIPASMQAQRVVELYHRLNADFVAVEVNFGGEWIEVGIKGVGDFMLDGREVSGRTVNVCCEHVSKGKVVRAEPVAALYDPSKAGGGIVHHVGTLSGLENQLCTHSAIEPAKVSPGRMDALVFALTKLKLNASQGIEGVHSEGTRRFSDRRRAFIG